MTADLDRRAAESLLAFWAISGVDAMLGEAPVNRLVPPPRASKPAPAAVASMPAGPVSGRPAPDVAAGVASAREAAAAATDLESLSAAIQAFDGCPLKFEGAKRSVFARGNPTADIMVIGEGPGGDEDDAGQPFVGRAGKLLDRMLAAARLTDRVFFTNTVFWRPPGNRTPTSAEQEICQPFVEKAIFLINPRYLLLAGGASAKAILKVDEGILSLRGRWFEWRAQDFDLTLPALPTLHPTFLLKQPAAKKKAWRDLLTLAERVDRPDRDG